MLASFRKPQFIELQHPRRGHRFGLFGFLDCDGMVRYV